MAYHLLTIHEVKSLSQFSESEYTCAYAESPQGSNIYANTVKSGTRQVCISPDRDFGFSCGEPKYRICFCGLHFEHLKEKKKTKLQAYSAKVSLFQGSAFFLNRVAGCLNSG